MTRRIATLLSILLSSLAFAVVVTVAQPPAPTAARSCVDASLDYGFAGEQATSNYRFGIYATFPGPYTIFPCSGFEAIAYANSSAWIAIVDPANANRIVQVGYIRRAANSGLCLPVGPEVGCDGRYYVFYAHGKDGNTPYAKIVSGPLPVYGPVPNTVLKLQIRNSGIGVNIYVDGVLFTTVYKDPDVPWIGNAGVRIQVLCESWDDGDSCGGLNAWYTLSGIRVQAGLGSSSWVSPGFASPCDAPGSNSWNHCQIPSGDSVRMSTDP
jgi:hypothetical protein